jgi:carboxylesterase
MEWNQPLYHESSEPNGRTGVLVLHGFTGSPRSLQELAERFVEAGYSVALPLLTGHGLEPQAMEKALWTDWTADVERAYAWLKERTDVVFVAGLSMGGTLTLGLAEHHPEIAGVITVNAMLRHPQEALMRCIGSLGLPRWLKPVANDLKCPGVDEKAYSKLPTRSAKQLALLLAAVRRDIAAVRCTALIFSSLTDHVVPPANQREIYESIGSEDKELVPLHHSYHVATMDYDKEEIFSRSLAFVAAHAVG